MSSLLSDSPADVVRWLLVHLGESTIMMPNGQTIPAGLATDPNLDPQQPWPCYASDEPDGPDSVITVYDTQGRDDGRSMIDGERYEHHGIQIRVRAVTHREGYLKARQIAVAIDQAVINKYVAFGDGTGRAYNIPCISRTSNVIPLGKDTPNTKRRIFTINAVCPIGELV
jgi:Bacteriophage minor capsid protein